MKLNNHRTRRLILPALLIVALLGNLILPTSQAAFTSKGQSQRLLTLAERVAYQRAIEEVYWRHRIWPQDNPEPKPALDELMPMENILAKVEDCLRKSRMLESYWQKPITAEQLQDEMNRMATQTRQPEVLRELYEALDNDPFVIAECLARPALADRLAKSLYDWDERFHLEAKQLAEEGFAGIATVQQMKQRGGNYSELQFVKDEGGEAKDQFRETSPEDVKLGSRDWEEQLGKLAEQLSRKSEWGQAARYQVTSESGKNQQTTANEVWEQIAEGQFSRLLEDEERYYAVGVKEKSEGEVKVVRVEWKKKPFDEWWNEAREQMWAPDVATGASFRLATISAASACTPNTWVATTLTGAPVARTDHTALWTGSEMIIWGGFDGGHLNTGARYNPATNTWTATNLTGAPTARHNHSAIWTGVYMVIWGGQGSGSPDGSGRLNSGAFYSPTMNSWVALSSTGAPKPREGHTAVWNGSQMIVWGGKSVVKTGDRTYSDVYFNTGGKYTFSSLSWSATTTSGAPTARHSHTALWTGQMIVWGGTDGSKLFNTGARYNPSTNTWTATNLTGAPSIRYSHTAVYTGHEMIIWGGYGLEDGRVNTRNNGGRYNPSTNSWTQLTTVNAPVARYYHTAVFNGSEMIVWGGDPTPEIGGALNSGGRYNPSLNSWEATSLTGAPAARSRHTAVWAGTEMIVWGGSDPYKKNTGGRYCAKQTP